MTEHGVFKKPGCLCGEYQRSRSEVQKKASRH